MSLRKYSIRREVEEFISVEASNEEEAEELASDYPIDEWMREIKQVDVTLDEAPGDNYMTNPSFPSPQAIRRAKQER